MDEGECFSFGIKVEDVLLQDNLGDHPDVRFAVDYSSTNVQKDV